MNSYTVHYRFAREHVDATDSDMAVLKAAGIIAQDLSIEDRGDLVAVELHGDNGFSDFYYAGTDLTSSEVDEVIERKDARPLPPRRALGMTLNIDDGELYVTSFGYASSLLAAYHEEELLSSHRQEREPLQLSPRRMKVIQQWMDNYDRYLDQ